MGDINVEVVIDKYVVCQSPQNSVMLTHKNLPCISEV